MKIETIETSRLFLRSFTKKDVDFAVSIWNDPDMGEYLSDPSLENMDDEYRAMLETLGEDPECCYLISESRNTGERIGTCSFIPGKDGITYDLAYCVHKNHWRKGYATEMVKGMMDYAKKKGAHRFTVYVNKENTASNGVMKKLGFSVIGEKSYHKRGTELTYSDFLYEKIL
ncbi:MAG: GNAT family N-acetyltransferase [Lachnospiraceae bacterium]|nr:GNAT family N-acetyltransferase [Lachnospiraceae bacterium]